MDPARQDDVGGAFKYGMVHVPHDEAGVRKYLEDYKALRLLSLQHAPRGLWLYVCQGNSVRGHCVEPGSLIGMSVIMGPLAIEIHDMPPLGLPQAASGGWDGANPLHFRLNATFTKPEARRKGVSKALIETSIKYVMGEAQVRNKEGIFSIVVDSDDLPARALYESVGFVEAARLERSDNGLPVTVLEYRPLSTSAKIGGV